MSTQKHSNKPILLPRKESPLRPSDGILQKIPEPWNTMQPLPHPPAPATRRSPSNIQPYGHGLVCPETCRPVQPKKMFVPVLLFQLCQCHILLSPELDRPASRKRTDLGEWPACLSSRPFWRPPTASITCTPLGSKLSPLNRRKCPSPHQSMTTPWD